jgi:replicative DNA helicase
MIEKQLINLLLEKDFYEENKGRVSKSMFTNGTGKLYETITKAHSDSESNISIDELATLHTQVYNPALTRAAKDNFYSLLEEVKKEKPNKKIATTILEAMHKQDIARRIAVVSTNIYNNTEESNFNDIQSLIDELKGVNKEEFDTVTNDINKLIDELKDNTKWKFNLTDLKNKVNGIGEGNLIIVFARPESGKTAFWVNMVAGQNGFATQGAKVCALINEEPAIRTQMRLINAHTGMTFAEIKENPTKASELWGQIKDKIRILDTVDWTLEKIDSYVAKEKPDVLIIDQLDKVHMGGSFARGDEKLRAIYTGAREIAKRRDCSLIGISQASADASGKWDMTFDMMENSKTGKAAEADVIIGVGYKPNSDYSNDNDRSLSVSKNKITGWHGKIMVKIVPEVSRYRD